MKAVALKREEEKMVEEEDSSKCNLYRASSLTVALTPPLSETIKMVQSNLDTSLWQNLR